MTKELVDFLTGQVIKEIRQEKGFSTKDIAQHLEMTRSSIINMENGRQAVSIFNLIRMCQLFQVRPEFLMFKIDSRITYNEVQNP